MRGSGRYRATVDPIRVVAGLLHALAPPSHERSAMNDRKANEASSPGDDAAAVAADESKLENEGGPSQSVSASARPAPFTPVKKRIERLGVGVFGLERIRPR